MKGFLSMLIKVCKLLSILPCTGEGAKDLSFNLSSPANGQGFPQVSMAKCEADETSHWPPSWSQSCTCCLTRQPSCLMQKSAAALWWSYSCLKSLDKKNHRAGKCPSHNGCKPGHLLILKQHNASFISPFLLTPDFLFFSLLLTWYLLLVLWDTGGRDPHFSVFTQCLAQRLTAWMPLKSKGE